MRMCRRQLRFNYPKKFASIDDYNTQQSVQQLARRITKTLAPVFVQFSTLIVIIIPICAVFLRNMTLFTPIFNQKLGQGKLMAAVDSQK